MCSMDEIQKTVANYGALYGAKRIYLFGSYARGEATGSSDIDLRIDKGRIRGLKMAALLIDIKEELGVDVDLVTTSSLDIVFLDRIKNDEVLLYEDMQQG